MGARSQACGRGGEAGQGKAGHAAALREGWYLIDEYVLLETERTFLKLLRQVAQCQRRLRPNQATSEHEDHAIPPTDRVPSCARSAEAEGAPPLASPREDRAIPQSDGIPAFAPASALLARAKVVEQSSAGPNQATLAGGVRGCIELHKVSPTGQRQSSTEPNQATAAHPLFPHQARVTAKRVELPISVGMGAELDEPDFACYSKCERTFHSGSSATAACSWDGPPCPK